MAASWQSEEQTSHTAACPEPHTLPAVMEPEHSPTPGTAQLTPLGWEPLDALAGLWSRRWPVGTLNHGLFCQQPRRPGPPPPMGESKFSPEEATTPFCWRKAPFTGLGLGFDEVGGPTSGSI